MPGARLPDLELDIRIDDLRGEAIIALLREHLDAMRRVSPPESVHALDLAGLRQPDITFWSAWDGVTLAGCAALKGLDDTHGEIKSMRTASSYVRLGVASSLLRHLIAEAQRRRYRRLSLETGAMDYFAPAHGLYGRFGFVRCAPFASYTEDPYSVFMTLELGLNGADHR
ncbi:MAG TPA: GNAT family N-acetyltransferase [Casimicrobiaceae bacterium]|nr:GNAT family N-acetyltransferase [Casimicrobiaceae bacterium]